MDIKLLLELGKHNVYFVRTDVVNYYISIPKNSFNETNISIEIKSKMGNYNIDESDEVWVLENVKNTYNYIDEYNITLILPILSNDNLSILEKIDTFKFDVIDKILGNIINTSFKILTENSISVLPNIVLINNDRYKTFINWFTSKYNGRVICKNMLEVIHLFNVSATSYFFIFFIKLQILSAL